MVPTNGTIIMVLLASTMHVAVDRYYQWYYQWYYHGTIIWYHGIRVRTYTCTTGVPWYGRRVQYVRTPTCAPAECLYFKLFLR